MSSVPATGNGSSELPWRVVHNKDAKLCPWNVIGPDGLESGHNSEKDAKRTAKKYNDIYLRGWNAANRAARSEKTQPSWTLLAERRPEGDEDILTADVRGHLHCKPSQAVRTAWGWAIKEKDQCFYTHWMPLPEAPNE